MSRPLTEKEKETITEWFDKKLKDLLLNRDSLKRPRVEFLLFRDYAYWCMSFGTGFRINELCSMRWCWVYDFKRNMFIDNLHVPKDYMKGKYSKRETILTSGAKKALRMLMDHWQFIFRRPIREDGDEPIFQVLVGDARKKYDEFGNELPFEPKKMDNSTMHKRLQKIFSLLEGDTSKVSSHSIRKYFCNTMYQKSGKDVIKTSLYTGHKNLSTLLNYINRQDEAMNNFLSDWE